VSSALDKENDRAIIACMTKGEETRAAVLEQAFAMASRLGLEGLTIGNLAEAAGLSKSGLFAHFQSKEALQVETLRFAAQLFIDNVIRPALKARRGEPRVRALFERWLEWAKADTLVGGCLFVAASTELDDREGPARQELVRQQKDWLEFVSTVAGGAVTEGHFRAKLDTEQFAIDVYGVMLACHHSRRLLRDPRAEERARRAFDALILAARPPRPARSARAHS
jgi:AcrR family transcriptional regulator